MAKNKGIPKLDARPDGMDFRDLIYQPTLVEVPLRRDLKEYQANGVPILDQGQEGACTGFGLATVVHYLLKSRRVVPDDTAISPRMLYEMAKRHDEWAGEDYSGSSARGAMKGWHKYGVCSEKLWRYIPTKDDRILTEERAQDAAARPLGAYLRVNHKNLVAIHAALAEVGILYATATVHEGWQHVGKDGEIPLQPVILGGHAFAIVAYDENGLWIQNSWGPDWGNAGFGRISYDDWLRNGTDVWVARLGVPIKLKSLEGSAATRPGTTNQQSYGFTDLRPHIVSLGNDGMLRPSGVYGSTPQSVRNLVQKDIPKDAKRILLYAHGGLVGESGAIQRTSDLLPVLEANDIYPLSLIWKTDAWTTITNILRDALQRRRPEGLLDAAKDFMLDRLDDALEPLARVIGGKALWDEMKENALLATTQKLGGLKILLDELDGYFDVNPTAELHVVGHSAGSILHGPLVQYWTTKGTIPSGPMKGIKGLGRTIATCTLWAPAITVDLFKQCYLPSLRNKSIEEFAVFTLTDKAERDDNCASIYHKSLLYFVANAFESRLRIPLTPLDGVPILGMEKFIRKDDELTQLLKPGKNWILAPNNDPVGTPGASQSKAHGAFDDDAATLRATLARILGHTKMAGRFVLHRSDSASRDIRNNLLRQSRIN